jgi:hypothetical protein
VTATAESLQLNAARDVVARLNDPETGGRFERWVERARGCRQPVRLRGASYAADAATGVVVREFNQYLRAGRSVADAVRESPRARVPGLFGGLRGDAFQIVAAGLRGGKGVPESVVGHPWVFATFTAPSFGPVHTIRDTGDGKKLVCRPRARGETCRHGRSLACNARHAEDDPCLGEAI